MKKILLVTTFLFLLTANQANAFSIYCTNCSDRFVQAMDRVTNVEQLKSLYKEYAESLTQTTQQIEMVRQNVEQYANMVQNTLALPSQVIATISSELQKFAQITNSLNTLRSDIMGLENIFDGLYQTQGDFENLANLPREMVSGRNSTMRANLDLMSERVDEATKATFQLSGQQLKDIEMSGQTEGYINKLLSTPTGQMQALMSGNQLTAMQLQEGRQLRELMATTIQSDLASQIKDEKEAQASEELARKITNMDNFNPQPTDDGF